MPSLDTQASLLESILRTVGILFGISFSLIILSFNIFYRYFGRYAFQDFFKNRSAKICITLLFSTVLLLSYSVYFIRETIKINPFTNFVFFFSIILSITSFFSIFPCFINLLRNSQNRRNIIRLFDKLNEDVTISRYFAKIDDDLLTFNQKDPINIINEIGLMSIKESDAYNIELITDTMITFFRNNITNQKENKYYVEIKDLYYKFNETLENYYYLALKEKNEYIATIAMRTIFRIENIVLQNITNVGFEFSLEINDRYRYLNLNFTAEKFFKKALQYGEDDICFEIIDEYRSFAISAFIKLFPDDVNYNGNNRFEVTQKCEDIFEPLAKLNSFSEVAVSAKKSNLFKELFNSFYTIEQKIFELNTTDSTKCLIFNVIHNYKKECFQKYIELNDVQQISYLNFPFKEGIFIYEKTKCKIPFFGFLEILDLVFSKGKLNNVIINQAKAQMLHLIRIEDEILIKVLIEKFVELSKKINDNDNEYKKNLYIKLFEYLKIVQQEATTKPASDIVKKQLISAISSFEKVDLYKESLQKIGYVSDERIV